MQYYASPKLEARPYRCKICSIVVTCQVVPTCHVSQNINFVESVALKNLLESIQDSSSATINNCESEFEAQCK